MTEIWTNRTWYDWLKKNQVKAGEYALVEKVGKPSRARRLIATDTNADQLLDKIPPRIPWTIVFYFESNDPAVGTHYPSADQMAALKLRHSKKR